MNSKITKVMMGDTARDRLEKLAGPGGPLEVRDNIHERWLSQRGGTTPLAPALAEILSQLFPIEGHLLEWLYEQRAELGPYDYSWQDVRRTDLIRYFDFTDEQCGLLVDDLGRLNLVELRRGETIGLTQTAIEFLTVLRPAR